MEEGKIQDVVREEISENNGMKKINNALNKMLGKDKEALEEARNFF